MHEPAPADDQAELAGVLRRLQSATQLDLATMLAIWQGRSVDRWSRSPPAYQLLANRLLGVGEPLIAYDVADEGLQYWPTDVRLRQLQALALARSGASERAQSILRVLYDEGHTDEETIGLLARTYKDLAFATGAPRPRPTTASPRKSGDRDAGGAAENAAGRDPAPPGQSDARSSTDGDADENRLAGRSSTPNLSPEDRPAPTSAKGSLSADLPDGQRLELRLAADLYAEAYSRHGGYWSGINAATLATLLGERERAIGIARSVYDQCDLLLKALPDGADAYWLVATLGEASIILEQWAQAEQWYARAAEYGLQRLGDLVSTRRNARQLLAHSGGERDRIQRALHVPSVAVFTGHMVDHPDRPWPRFPPHFEAFARNAIRERLIEHDCLIGYASAAAGADVLFLETLLELGGEANVVLPYATDEFLRDNAGLVGDASWTERSRRVLERAARVVIAQQQQTAAGATTFEFANLMLDGLASNRAEHLDTSLVRVAFWDGKPGDGPGGTASAVGRWQRLGLPVDIVTPPAHEVTPLAPGVTPLTRDVTPPLPGVTAIAPGVTPPPPSVTPPTAGVTPSALDVIPPAASVTTPALDVVPPASSVTTPAPGVTPQARDVTPPPPEPPSVGAASGFESEIVAMLFGDAVHFSKLAEEEIVRFGQHFLGSIGHLIGSSSHAPVLKNTWGDGLFFVFSSVRDAGMFALALRDLVNDTNWAAKGLPSSLNLRIGLHAGSVFSYTDPITQRPNYLGTQVSRAARIEPITPPGHVYASEAFAALSAAEHIADFTCDYVGQTPLAKGYGTFPMYHVRPT